MNFTKKMPESRFTVPKGNYHIAVFGETGMGKSVTVKSIAEARYEAGFKIMDVYDGASCEGCFYCLESNHDFWTAGEKRGRGGKAYPMNGMIPVILSRIPKQIPKVCSLFRIPVYSLLSDDIKALIGKKVSTSVNTLWSVVERQIRPSTTGEELLEIIKKSTKSDKEFVGGGKQGLTVLYNALEPLVREGLLCASDDPLAIDLYAEIKDRTKISVLILKFVPPSIGSINIRSFLVQYIIRKIWELKQEGKGLKKRVCLVMREATDFLSKGSVGEMGESDMAVRDIIAKVIKQGRKFNLVAIIDAQSPSMIYDAINGQFRVVIAHRIQDFDDLDKVVSPAVKSQISFEFKWRIGELPRGKVAVLKPRDRDRDGMPVGQGCFFSKILPPRSRFMNEGEDFFEVYRESLPNDVIFTKPLLDQVAVKKVESETKIRKKTQKEEENQKYDELITDFESGDISGVSLEELSQISQMAKVVS